MRAEARKLAERAYQPYSDFSVGAALLLENGDLIGGCNVENASYGLTSCAERNALFNAVAQGFSCPDFKALMVYTPGNQATSPCGACRQVILELMPEDAFLVSVCDSDQVIEWQVADVLPRPFTPERLQGDAGD